MMRLCDDALIPQYKRLTDIIHAEGTPVIPQLALGADYRDVTGRCLPGFPSHITMESVITRPLALPKAV